MMPMSYMPGDPTLIANIVCELKSQGIFDTFRKECIADVDTKPAYQNLRQRVDGSVSSFLKKQVWSADLNKNQLREQLRKYICQSGFLEIGVERIVDQVVNPKMNSVFLPKVTDVVYQYLGLSKPDAKTVQEKEDELKIKTEDLLPKELEAVSPESRHDEEPVNEDSNESSDEMKIDEDESPPFEPLDEDNSIDSQMSGISGLQSHDSDLSMKGLKVENLEISKNGSEDSTNNSIPKSTEKVDVQLGDSNAPVDPDPESVSNDKKEKDKDKNKASNDKDKRQSSSSSSHSKSKHSKDREHKSNDRERDRSRHGKDRDRSSSSHHSDRKKDVHRSKDRHDDKDRRSRDRSEHKSSKSRDSKSRSRHDSERKSSSSRSDRDKDKSKRSKDKKDDHYSSKHKSERRSTDRDSNDGSGLKSSSSSYGDSNSSTQLSQKVSSNSNDSGQSGNSADGSKHKGTVASLNGDVRSHRKRKSESPKMEPEPVEAPSMSVSAATWDALEAQMAAVAYDTYYDPDSADSQVSKKPKVVNDDPNLETPSETPPTGDIEKVSAITGNKAPENESDELKYFNENENDDDEAIAQATKCITKLEQEIEGLQTKRIRSLGKKAKHNLNAKDFINDAQVFHLPLSPAESESEKVNNERKAEMDVFAAPEMRKKNIIANQRYSSEDLYKPRPVIKRSTTRRRANL